MRCMYFIKRRSRIQIKVSVTRSKALECEGHSSHLLVTDTGKDQDSLLQMQAAATKRLSKGASYGDNRCSDAARSE